MPEQPPTKPWNVSLIILLVCAAFLRLYRLDLISITADEGIHGLVSMNIAIFENWPLVGLPSVGIRNSAFFVYLLAVPYLFVRHPLSGAVFVALLNVGTIYFAYRIAREFVGRPAAEVAGWLLVFSPWAVLYGRNMWPPSCVGFFSMWLVWISLRWLEDGGRRRLFTMTVFCCLIPQVHFSGFCAPVWTAVVMAAGFRKIRALPILGGLAVGLASLIPWFYYQHFINQWLDLQQALRVTEGKRSLLPTLAVSLSRYGDLLSSRGFSFWFNKSAEQLPEYFPPLLVACCRYAAVVVIVFFVASCVWVIWRRNRTLLMLLCWCVLPPLLLLVIRPVVHPHYVLVAFPVPFILIGAAGQRWFAHRRGGCVALAAVVTFVSLCHLGFLAGWYRFVDDGRPTGYGHYQLSYRQRLRAVDGILDDCTGKLVDLAGPFNGQCPAYQLIYHHEQYRRGYTDFPRDWTLRYWVDEFGNDSTSPDWQTIRHWTVGPVHIFRQVRRR